MYKILIKKPQLPKDSFVFYTEVNTDINEETNEITKTIVIYQTDSLSDLAAKYQELLTTYNTSQLKLVQDLDIEMIINVNDNTKAV